MALNIGVDRLGWPETLCCGWLGWPEILGWLEWPEMLVLWLYSLGFAGALKTLHPG